MRRMQYACLHFLLACTVRLSFEHSTSGSGGGSFYPFFYASSASQPRDMAELRVQPMEAFCVRAVDRIIPHGIIPWSVRPNEREKKSNNIPSASFSGLLQPAS